MVIRSCCEECLAGMCLTMKGASEPFIEQWFPNYDSRVKCEFEHILLTLCDDRNAIQGRFIVRRALNRYIYPHLVTLLLSSEWTLIPNLKKNRNSCRRGLSIFMADILGSLLAASVTLCAVHLSNGWTIEHS